MIITPDLVRTTYEYLIQIKPFNKWNLPGSDQVEFEVIPDRDVMGLFVPDPHVISISKSKHHHLDTVLKTVAHEICHLKMYLDGQKYEEHNKDFRKLTKQVAKEFGFDYKEL